MADSRFVINYWKLSGDNRLIFGGGENYRRGFPSDIKGFVQQYMLQVYPQLAEYQIDYGWGGTSSYHYEPTAPLWPSAG